MHKCVGEVHESEGECVSLLMPGEWIGRFSMLLHPVHGAVAT